MYIFIVKLDSDHVWCGVRVLNKEGLLCVIDWCYGQFGLKQTVSLLKNGAVTRRAFLKVNYLIAQCFAGTQRPSMRTSVNV